VRWIGIYPAVISWTPIGLGLNASPRPEPVDTHEETRADVEDPRLLRMLTSPGSGATTPRYSLPTRSEPNPRGQGNLSTWIPLVGRMRFTLAKAVIRVEWHP
jgi:hypothetical protein